jgi:hypothetical protein
MNKIIRLALGCFFAILLLSTSLTATASIIATKDDNQHSLVDTDGPVKGGLDDRSDYIHLAAAALLAGSIGFNFIRLFKSGSSSGLFFRISSMGISGIIALRELLEAFDLRDCDRDGR